jgi:hypothetical protein
MSRQMIDYFDRWGMIVQANKDGGDSCQRFGMYHLGIFFGISFVRDFNLNDEWPFTGYMSYQKTISLLECPDSPDNYRRHPDPTKWYSDSDRLSRDQFIPLIIGLGLYSMKNELSGLFRRHLNKRFLLFSINTKPNGVPSSDPTWKIPDLTLFSVWALYIRSFNRCRNKYMKYLTPLLWVFDSAILVNSIIITIRGDLNPEETSDDLNHIITLLYALTNMPTPIAKLAKFIYKFRPKTLPPACGYQSDFGPQTALDYYFREESGAPPMNELYRSFLEKMLKS